MKRFFKSTIDHKYDLKGICIHCGCSRSAIEKFDWQCNPRLKKKLNRKLKKKGSRKNETIEFENSNYHYCSNCNDYTDNTKETKYKTAIKICEEDITDSKDIWHGQQSLRISYSSMSIEEHTFHTCKFCRIGSSLTLLVLLNLGFTFLSILLQHEYFLLMKLLTIIIATVLNFFVVKTVKKRKTINASTKNVYQLISIMTIPTLLLFQFGRIISVDIKEGLESLLVILSVLLYTLFIVIWSRLFSFNYDKKVINKKMMQRFKENDILFLSIKQHGAK